MAERQDQGGVGIGPDRQPLDIAAGVEIFRGRRHVDEAHARVAQGVEAGFDVVHGGAAGVDLGVLARHAAEGHEQLAMLGQHVPARMPGLQLLHRGHDMRHQHARGTETVGIRHGARSRRPNSGSGGPGFGRGGNDRRSTSHRSHRRSICFRSRASRGRVRRPRGRAPRPRSLRRRVRRRASGMLPGPFSSQLLRTAGRRTRNRATSSDSICRPMGEGSGSFEKG